MNAIMNEKGRQTKLLAAIAIIAMVACVFAVVLPAEDADASTVTVGDDVSFEFPDYLTGTYDSKTSTITVSGVTMPAENSDVIGTDEKTTFESIFGDNSTKNYAFFMMNGLTGLVPEDGTLTIVQKNAAMNGFYGAGSFNNDTKTKAYTAEDVSDGIGMLIPKGEENTTVEVTIGEIKYTIDFSDVITVAGTLVTSETELNAALTGEATDIIIGANFSVSKVINITKAVNIYGNGYTISASGSQPWTGNGTKNIVNIQATTSAVLLDNVVLDSKDVAYGVNVYNSSDVTINKVSSVNSAGAGMVVGTGATATVTESAMDGIWGGINVDKGGKVTLDSMDNIGSVYSENTSGTNTIEFTDDYTAPVTLTGNWKDGEAEATTYNGYYESIDDAVAPYNDSRIVKDQTVGALPTITVSDDTVLTTDFTMSVGTLTVSEGATLVVDENVTLDVSKATATGEYIASAGSEIAFATGSEAKAVAAPGATVTVGDEAAVTAESATASTFEEAFELAGYGVPVTISEDVTLAENVAIPTGMDIRMADDKKVTLGTYMLVTDNSKFTGTVAGTDAEANVALSGSYTIKSGSISVDGRISGSIEMVNGNAIISGTIDGDLEISGTGKVTFEDATVNSNADVTITAPTDTAVITYTVEGKFWLYGGLLIADDKTSATVTVAENSEFKAFGNSTIAPSIAVVGTDSTSKIDLGDAMGTQYIRQDVTSNLVYSQTQTVIIEESIFIKKSASLTVYGQLIVNEGVEVIIEDGGKLIVDNQTAKVTINGDIEVENGGAMDIVVADTVDVSGTIISDGELTINSNVTVKNGGKIQTENGDASMLTISGEGAKLTVEVGGNVEIRSQAAVSDITNKGTVTLNGAILNGDVKISLAADGAVVDIKSFTSGTTASKLEITDNGLVFKDNKDPAKVVKVEAADANSLVINGQANGGVKGLVITESVTSETVNKETTYYNSLILSGSVTIADETATGEGITSVQMDVSGPSVDVNDALTIGKNVILNLTSGNLDVSGTITATADKAQVKATAGDINVSGMIETCEEITANINAFSYEGTLDGEPVYYYTTLKTAIDNGETDIEALGTTGVLESVDIPAETEIKAGPGHEKITIGSSDARDVVVTVKDGGEFRSCVIDVMGTLTFDNKRDDRNNTITSDVFVEDDVSKSYTNIYTALNNAEAGETVTIYRSGSNVILDKDITVKEGVTLDIPSGKGVSVVDNVTVTVDGTIRNSGTLDNVKYDQDAEAYVVGSGFNPESDNNASIVVNGAFMAVEEVPYVDDAANGVQGYYIPGAYYNLVNTAGNWHYVTPVEDAATVSNDVSEGKIDIRGTNQVGDVVFTGDEDTPVTIILKGKLTASSLKLTYASIEVVNDDNKYQFDGTVTTDVGSVEFVNANGFEIDSYVNDEAETVMTLSDKPMKADTEGADAKVTVATGNVTVANTNDGDDLDVTGTEFVIAEGATLTVDGLNAKLNAKDLAVNGTLVAYDGGNVTAMNVYVIGTFTVSPADNDNNVQAGSATITDNVRVGISDDFETTSAATLNADKIGEWNNLYVSAESTVTEDLIKSKEYTQFYVEDALWFTVYANTTADRSVKTPDVIPTENALLEDWTGTDANGDTKNYNGNEEFNISVVERFDANINYNIYRVTIFADPGISAVYIDGILMTSGYFENPLGGSDNVTMAAGFQAYVSAGEHEITYKLGNYFSGEAQMTVNGEAVTGNTFTTSGMPDKDANGDYKTSVDYVVYLQGIEASAPETPSTPSTGSSDDGMGLTDYLLIILIVLIVIMAIMVALRLMRS